MKRWAVAVCMTGVLALSGCRGPQVFHVGSQAITTTGEWHEDSSVPGKAMTSLLLTP